MPHLKVASTLFGRIEFIKLCCDLSRSPDDEDTWNGSVPTGMIAGDLRLAVVFKNQTGQQELLKFEVKTN